MKRNRYKNRYQKSVQKIMICDAEQETPSNPKTRTARRAGGVEGGRGKDNVLMVLQKNTFSL